MLATADALDARGWRTKSWVTRSGKPHEGIPWDKQSVHRLLTSITYTGRVFYKGEVYGGEHAPIIDEETFARVQALLRRQSAQGGAARQSRHPFLLRGLLRCQACGSPMSPRWSTSRGREYRYYVCTGVDRRGTEACPVRSIPAGPIEDFVVEQVRGIATEPALIARVVENLEQRRAAALPPLQAERARLEAEHRRCCDEARGIFASLGQALGDRDGQRGSLATGRLAALEERAGQLERRLAELRDEIAAIERQHVSLVDAHRALSLFDPVWDVLLPREGARILALLLEVVEYDGNQGEVALTFYPLGIGRLAAEAASASGSAMEAAMEAAR